MLLYQPFCQSERGKLYLCAPGSGWIGELNLDRTQSACISVQSSLFQSYTQGTQTMHSRHVAYVYWINKEINAWTEEGKSDVDAMVGLFLNLHISYIIVFEPCLVFHVTMVLLFLSFYILCNYIDILTSGDYLYIRELLIVVPS